MRRIAPSVYTLLEVSKSNTHVFDWVLTPDARVNVGSVVAILVCEALAGPVRFTAWTAKAPLAVVDVASVTLVPEL